MMLFHVLIILGSVMNSILSDAIVLNDQAGQHSATQNMDPPLEIALAKEMNSLEETFKEYQQNLDAKISAMQTTCEAEIYDVGVELLPEEAESKIDIMVDKFVDILLRFEVRTVDDIKQRMLASLNNTLSKIDDKLQPIQDTIDTLKTDMSKLMTEDEVLQLEQKLVELAGYDLEQEDEILWANLREKLDQQVTNITDLIDDISHNSESEVKLLNRLADFDENLSEVKKFVVDVQQTNEQYSKFDSITDSLVALTKTTGENAVALTNLENSLENIGNEITSRINDIQNAVENIEQSPSQTAVAEERCVDSKFTGPGRSMDICSAAVRFSKCSLKFVSFHCCKSCRDAGAIRGLPTDFTAERNVRILEGLKSISSGATNIRKRYGK